MNFSLEITNPDLKKQYDAEQRKAEEISTQIQELQRKMQGALGARDAIMERAVLNGETRGILIKPKSEEKISNLIQLTN